MKKTSLLLATCLLLLSCGGTRQTPEDSAVKWNEGDIKGKVKSIIVTNTQYLVDHDGDSSEGISPDVMLQVYNTKGQLSESRWYDHDSILVQRLLFEYDINGQLTRNDYIDYSKETGQVDSSYFLFTYNDGKIAKEETYRAGKLNSWSETAYNDNGDISLFQLFRDGKLVSESKYEYLYNDDKRKVEEKTHTNGSPSLTVSWEYDGNGRTLSAKTKDGSIAFAESYQYDDKGHLIKETLTPDGMGMKRVSTYLYDSNGNMVEYLQKTEEGNIIRCCCYTYDMHGNWIHSTEEHGAIRMVCERKIEYYE